MACCRLPDPLGVPIDTLRALLVILHLLAITLMAAPAPVGGMTRANFASQSVQDLLTAVGDGLRGAGLELSHEQVEDGAWTLGTGFMKARAKALKPALPYTRYTGASQGWSMFWTVNKRPGRLVVEVQEGARWRRVYQSLSPEHRWLAPTLESERYRAVVSTYAWRSNRKSWVQFAPWLGQRALADFPDATAVRVSMEQLRRPHTALGEPPTVKELPAWQVIVQRDP